jgi:hypothetical protein
MEADQILADLEADGMLGQHTYHLQQQQQLAAFQAHTMPAAAAAPRSFSFQALLMSDEPFVQPSLRQQQQHGGIMSRTPSQDGVFELHLQQQQQLQDAQLLQLQLAGTPMPYMTPAAAAAQLPTSGGSITDHAPHLMLLQQQAAIKVEEQYGAQDFAAFRAKERARRKERKRLKKLHKHMQQQQQGMQGFVYQPNLQHAAPALQSYGSAGQLSGMHPQPLSGPVESWQQQQQQQQQPPPQSASTPRDVLTFNRSNSRSWPHLHPTVLTSAVAADLASHTGPAIQTALPTHPLSTAQAQALQDGSHQCGDTPAESAPASERPVLAL